LDYWSDPVAKVLLADAEEDGGDLSAARAKV
jgi:hypothetical protein